MSCDQAKADRAFAILLVVVCAVLIPILRRVLWSAAALGLGSRRWARGDTPQRRRPSTPPSHCIAAPKVYKRR